MAAARFLMDCEDGVRMTGRVFLCLVHVTRIEGFSKEVEKTMKEKKKGGVDNKKEVGKQRQPDE